MYFDFEDHRPDTPHLFSPLTWRDVVFLSIIIHLLGLLTIVTAPRWLVLLRSPDPEQQAQLRKPPPDQQAPRFVFVQPKVDKPAPAPPPRAELSDQDRLARQQEKALTPQNPLPFARGNSSERVERSQEAMARGQGPRPDPAPEMPQAAPEEQKPESQLALLDNNTGRVPPSQPQNTQRSPNRLAPGGGDQPLQHQRPVPAGGVGQAARCRDLCASAARTPCKQTSARHNEHGGQSKKAGALRIAVHVPAELIEAQRHERRTGL